MRKGGRRYPTKRKHIYTVKTKTHSLRRKKSSPLWSRRLKYTNHTKKRSKTRSRTRSRRKRRKKVKRGGGFLGIGNSLMSFF